MKAHEVTSIASGSAERACIRYLEERGHETNGHLSADIADEKERYSVWCVDSLLWTVREIKAGRNREALRGLLQCAKYHGYLHGFWPEVGLGYYYTDLQNFFEAQLREASE